MAEPREPRKPRVVLGVVAGIVALVLTFPFACLGECNGHCTTTCWSLLGFESSTALATIVAVVLGLGVAYFRWPSRRPPKT